MKGAAKRSEILSTMELPGRDIYEPSSQEIYLDIQDKGDMTAVTMLKELPLGGRETSLGITLFYSSKLSVLYCWKRIRAICTENNIL